MELSIHRLRIKIDVLEGVKQVANHAATAGRKPYLFITVFSMWFAALYWFHPRLAGLLDSANSTLEWLSMGYFVVFVEIAWLYGLYNIAIVLFSLIDRWLPDPSPTLAQLTACSNTPVAILYTTCNDFVEASAASCMDQDYENYRVYLLDDSSDPVYQDRVDKFAAKYPGRAKVIRRLNKSGYKAGNLNHALMHHVFEPLFAIVDADEILPRDFLQRMVPKLESDKNCGFVQANHICRKRGGNRLTNDMAVGIDIHWKWYQPLRNRFGFVMFLGHGALLKRECWKKVSGFPELVSEDLAYAIAIRELGYYGSFAKDVVCLEEFPETVRAFRVRHMKWTRGTCEFLAKCLPWLLRSRNISLTEKLDILFPTINLPLTFFFFLFMINSGIVLPFVMGEHVDVTLVVSGAEYVVPMLTMPPQFKQLYSADFYAITVLTIMSPVLCFILEMITHPAKLYRFLSNSTALYATLSPLTMLAVTGFLFTGKARFLVTGDNSSADTQLMPKMSLIQRVDKFLSETHPDSAMVRNFEIFMGILFLVTAVYTFQVSIIGMAFGFILMPIMHMRGWERRSVRSMAWVPFAMMMLGITLGATGVFGLYPVFFGYGFHF